jgi:hypothetical protein
MYGRRDKRDAEKPSGLRPHEEFLELCAVSTSGELSEEEQERLRDHLATCAECRRALQEFGAAADIGVPFLASALAASASSDPKRALEEVDGHPTIFNRARVEGARSSADAKERGNEILFPTRNGRGRTPPNWSYAWMSLAAALVLVSALGIYSFQFGKQRGQEIVQTIPNAPHTRMDALERQISDAGHEREVLLTELAQRNEIIAGLRKQVAEQSSVLAEVKSTEANLKNSLEGNQAETQQVVEERNGLNKKLETVEASLQSTLAELDAIRLQRSQDQSRAASLEAQIRDLNGQLREREQAFNKQEELLAHDRDIRDLMGARDLYIAEVYDVGHDGTTQKPYGRVFYTKGKSLVFYAYDLDQQSGAKNASTFQAWGRGGADRQQVLNLGIFYHDNGAKKRWVLKFDDPHTLEQLDAVFVTVEPMGGSHKPSSRPLLFASLRILANHP